MLKKTVLFAVALLMLPIFANAEGIKLGYVDSQAIFQAMPDLSKIEDAMATFNKDNMKYLQDMEKELQTKQTELESSKGKVSETVMKMKQQELQELYQRYQQAGQTLQTEAQKKQQELLQPVQKKIKDAIDAVGKKNNFYFIFDITTGSIAYKNENAVDVTPMVKKQLGIL